MLSKSAMNFWGAVILSAMWLAMAVVWIVVLAVSAYAAGPLGFLLALIVLTLWFKEN